MTNPIRGTNGIPYFIQSKKEIATDLGYGNVLTDEQAAKVDAIEKEQWDVRENYWLETLFAEDFDKCIFIVGSEHINNIKIKLTKRNMETRVLVYKWEP